MQSENQDQEVVLRHVRNTERVSKIAGTLNLIVGLIVLLAWRFDLPVLRQLAPGFPAMVPNAAFAFVMTGILILMSIRSRKTVFQKMYRYLTGIMLLVIGASAAIEYFQPEIHLTVNHFLADLFVGPTQSLYGGQIRYPHITSAISFLILGLTILLLERRFIWAQVIALIGMIVPMAALTDQTFLLSRAEDLASDIPLAGMAVHTAFSFVIANIGLLSIRPREGVLSEILARTPSGEFFRRLIPAAVFVPLLLGVAATLKHYLPAQESVVVSPIVSITIVSVFLLSAGMAIRVVSKMERERNEILGRLQAAEAQYRGLFDGAHDSLIVVGSQGIIKLANSRVQEMFGYSASELVGQSIEILVPERFRRAHISQRDSYFSNPSIRLMGAGRELFARRKDGTEFAADIGLSSSPTSDGIVVTAIVRDVSARKQIESQKTFLSLVSKQLSASIDLKDTLDVASHMAVPEIADWCLIHLYDEHGELRLARYFISDPGKRPLLQVALDQHDISQTTGAAGVLRSVKSESSLIVSSISSEELSRSVPKREVLDALIGLEIRSYMICPLKTRTGVIGTITFATGFSGRHLAEKDKAFVEEIAQRVALAIENARLYEKAKMAVKTREDILSIVSHDLKNPLSSVRLAAQTLKTMLVEKESVAFIASQIERSSHQMYRLAQSLLDFGKIESGTFAIEREQVSLSELIADIRATFEVIAKDRKINFQINAPDELKFSADSGRMFQVLSNLISNALKFTQEGGRVTLEVKREPNRLVFSVKDTGDGIPENDLAHIFDRYWQPKKNHKKGVGLGLFIAKGIVDAHGGTINVESVLQKGTTFRVSLPLAEKYQTASHIDGKSEDTFSKQI